MSGFAPALPGLGGPPLPPGPPGGPPAAPGLHPALAGLLAGLQAPPGAGMASPMPSPPGGPDNGMPDPEIDNQLRAWAKMANIADDLDDEELSTIAMRVRREYDLDESSREEWKSKYTEWMDCAMQAVQAKEYPWPKASNIIYPLLTTAAIQFAARAYPSIVRDRAVVKGTVLGDDPDGIKRTRADNIGRHMSWQLLDEQEEWEPQTDKLLITLPIVGCMFRKTYYDPTARRNMSETVSALQVCVNYKAKSFETAPRVTEILKLYPVEIEERIRAGLFLDRDYGTDPEADAGQDEDALVTFLEQHRRWDLDGDGYPEPYIVTISQQSQKLARIVAAFEPDDIMWGDDQRVRRIEAIAYYTKYGFIPSPESGVYDLGFGHLLYPINAGINTTLNQMFDAGHLANAGGGFIGTGLSMNAGSVRFQVGEYKPVNSSGGSIRDNIMPLPFQGPSTVLLQLLQFLVEAGKEVAAVKDVLSGDQPGASTSPTTLLAMIEQGMTVYTAIYKRIYRSLKQEFRKLYRLNRLYLPEVSGYRDGDAWQQITQSAYVAGAGVEPVSDPKMITSMQRLGRAEFLKQFLGDPMFNGKEIRTRILDAALIENVNSLLVQQVPPNPQELLIQAQIAELHTQAQLKSTELKIRGAHQEAEMDIRRGKDKASEIESLSRAILNLANAAKADHEINQNWYGTQLAALRLQMESLNAAAEQNSTENSPAAAAGVDHPTAGPANAVGNAAGAMAGMAPPSDQPNAAPVSG